MSEPRIVTPERAKEIEMRWVMYARGHAPAHEDLRDLLHTLAVEREESARLRAVVNAAPSVAQIRELAKFVLIHGDLNNGQAMKSLIIENIADKMAQALAALAPRAEEGK